MRRHKGLVDGFSWVSAPKPKKVSSQKPSTQKAASSAPISISDSKLSSPQNSTASVIPCKVPRFPAQSLPPLVGRCPKIKLVVLCKLLIYQVLEVVTLPHRKRQRQRQIDYACQSTNATFTCTETCRTRHSFRITIHHSPQPFTATGIFQLTYAGQTKPVTSRSTLNCGWASSSMMVAMVAELLPYPQRRIRRRTSSSDDSLAAKTKY